MGFNCRRATHVDAGAEVPRDPGSIPGASTQRLAEESASRFPYPSYENTPERHSRELSAVSDFVSDFLDALSDCWPRMGHLHPWVPSAGENHDGQKEGTLPNNLRSVRSQPWVETRCREVFPAQVPPREMNQRRCSQACDLNSCGTNPLGAGSARIRTHCIQLTDQFGTRSRSRWRSRFAMANPWRESNCRLPTPQWCPKAAEWCLVRSTPNGFHCDQDRTNGPRRTATVGGVPSKRGDSADDSRSPSASPEGRRRDAFCRIASVREVGRIQVSRF